MPRSGGFQGVVTGRVHKAAARFHFWVWVGGKQSLKKVAFLGGRGGWTGGEETAEGLCCLLFPGTFPTPDGCQALTDRSAEDAVVPR